jgi:2-polyprenyl-3-methyl-5-hydroxy-6-metoxy-1,4-benzoquinol methylase/tetratricopeptide (TPR) repeat protein
MQGRGADALAGGARSSSPQSAAGRLFAEAARQQHLGKLNDAARLYKQVLQLAPEHAEASNNLGCIYLAQGKPKDASVRFARALVLVPQLFDDFASICAMLVAVNPAIGEGMKRAAAAWPRRPSGQDLLGPAGVAAIGSDALLARVLESTIVRDIDLERLLTCVRRDLLRIASDSDAERADPPALASCCSLARQCFINEYVFAVAPEEAEQAEELKGRLVDALGSGARFSPLWVAAVAMYFPLYVLPGAALLDRDWKDPVAQLIAQQVREPAEEWRYCDSIPRLTAIEDMVSVRVREQYEENPYPRWVYAASSPAPITLDEHLRAQFPTAAFRPLEKDEIDILVAGCGTGRHPIEVARQYRGARILAVDLSVSSLCYAKRKTLASRTEGIEYGQADILKLGSLHRTFDLIEVSGVLHHLADPLAGWRVLLSLLRPGGFMHVGLYSELARRDVVAARAFIAERRYQPTADDIRRCRQELLESRLKSVARAGDFFSTSECRDLLFHVQESRIAIPQIKSFLRENGLRFIGFEFAPRVLQHYRTVFGSDSALRDLDRWHAYETERPDTFAGMYQFWVQNDS